MSAQTDRGAYRFERYGGASRFASYAYQLEEIFATAPERVLEVGVGDGVVSAYLKRQAGLAHTSIDIARDVGADVVGDVRALPFPDRSFDTVCAFEVLEHLPFSDAPRALSELSRVARRFLLISLPHFGPPVKLLAKLPFLPELRLAWKVPYPKPHAFNGQHYWELGKRGYPARRIRALIGHYGTLERDYVPFENQYHHFFVVRLMP